MNKMRSGKMGSRGVGREGTGRGTEEDSFFFVFIDIINTYLINITIFISVDILKSRKQLHRLI